MTVTLDDPPALDDEPTPEPSPARRRTSLVRRVAMRPRRVLVRVHRWTSVGLLAWLLVLSLTGAWLVERHAIESWLHGDRYRATSGDPVGPAEAVANVEQGLPERASIWGVTLPGNARGVYRVGIELPPVKGDAEPEYHVAFVDPGTGKVNDSMNEEEGFSWWMYRGHMYLWQDNGLFNAFHAETGWCRPDAKHHEPGGAKGVLCDVIPAGDDMVAWFAVAWIGVLLTGFYLWYWPGVRRWATAFAVKRGRGRFAFHMSVHKVVGLVVWLPLTAIAFTGAAFAFPNMARWYDNATPAERDFDLWTPPEEANMSGKAKGRDPISYDDFQAILEKEFPKREVHLLMGPADETGTYTAWVSRGFDPWTREGGAGNTLVGVDQYSGEVVYDGSPEDGNVADQLWDDWSFPVHTGDFGGPVTRVIWVFVGLSPILLGVTGVTMNLVRRRKRKRRARTAADTDADATAPPTPVPA